MNEIQSRIEFFILLIQFKLLMTLHVDVGAGS